MSFLSNLIDKAKSFLGRPQPAVQAKDAIRHDAYDAELYKELLRESGDLRSLVDDLGYDYSYTEDLVRDVLQQFWQAVPELRPSAEMEPGHLTNHAVSTSVASDPKTAETRTYTKHDKYGAALATLAVADRIKEYLEQNSEVQEAAEEAEKAQTGLEQALKSLQEAAQQAQDAQEEQEQAEEAPGGVGRSQGEEGPLTESQEAAEQKAKTTQESLEAVLAQAETCQTTADEAGEAAQAVAGAAQVALRPQISDAIQEVGEQLAEERELFAAWGINDGELKQMSFKERAALAQMLRGNRLSKFRELIGRFRIMAAAARAKKVEYGRDEVVGAELGDDPGRILASEYALFASGNRHLRRQFLIGLMESTLLVRQFIGIERVGHGAIIAVCDNSSSMSAKDKNGLTREAWAKAFMLALLDQARASKRDFVGINFSSANQQKVWRFPKGQSDLKDVVEMVEHNFNGGTNFERPLDLATDILEKEFNDSGKMKGDIVFITDDDCGVTPTWMQQHQARKHKLGFRTFGIAVGMARPGSTLASFSDNVRAVSEFADPSSVQDIMKVVT